jgi:tetratricopeptide (TPR) repeat protein
MKYRLFSVISLLCFCAALAPLAYAGSKEDVASSAKHVKSVKQTKFSGYDKDQVDGILDAVIDSLQDKTDVYWHHGDYPRIVSLDRVIVEIDPKFTEPYSTGGWLMESLGDLKDAEAFYQLGVERNKETSYLYYQLSAFYYNTLKDYKRSVKVSELGVKKSDADINDWRMLAHAYEKAGQLDKALETWKAIKSKYSNAEAVETNLDRVQRLLNNKSASGTAPASKPKDNNPVLNL